MAAARRVTAAESDPEAALKALTQHGEGMGDLAAGVVGAIAKRDHERAREILDSWPEDSAAARHQGRRDLWEWRQQ